MTNSQFLRAYWAAKRQFSRTSVDMLMQAKRVYARAANEAARQIALHLEAGHSELTVDAWRNLERQLRATQATIARDIETIIKTGVRLSASRFTALHVRRMQDMVGVMARLPHTGKPITAEGLRGIGLAVNNRVVLDMIQRIGAKGYSFSDRTWRAATNWANDVKNVVSVGIGQGLAPAKIARSLTRYTRDGKIALARNFGPNVSDKPRKGMTPEQLKAWQRIPNNIDYRALRIVRSEMYMSIQNAQARAGDSNPGCTGWFNWTNIPGRLDWDCPCEEYQRNSPYRYEDIPDYPHPNCQCTIDPIMRDEDQFFDDLVKWGNGTPIDYLDEWYNEHYLPYAKNEARRAA